MNVKERKAAAEFELLTRQLEIIYDDYYNALWKLKYITSRLSTIQRYNKGYEITLAIGTSSVITGWALWQSTTGKLVWSLFGGLVAILTVLKPILELTKKIEIYSKQYTGYTNLYYDFSQLVNAITLNKAITTEMAKSYADITRRLVELQLQDDVAHSHKLKEKSQAEAMDEIQQKHLWKP